MRVEFEVLGDVRALAGGELVELGPARQRAVLAALLVDANRLVTVDQLVDRVWGERSPATVARTISSYLSRLRVALRGADGFGVSSLSGGYVLRVSPGSVDLHRFTELLATAGDADDGNAARCLDEALALWRGEAFAGMHSSWFDTVRHRLETMRHTARLDRVDIRLRGGRHSEVLPELVELADGDPLDERVAAQLVLALYRCGRRSEALERYDQIRKLLADEVGADPGLELVRLHDRVLRSDGSLVLPGSRTPRQLPGRPQVFIGRDEELSALGGLLDRRMSVVISAVGGVGGIGKTWLALHWAHSRLGDFPDGQLFANLHGFDPSAPPTRPEVVLRGFLEALGTASDAIPPDVDAQAALYRTLLAERRMLIVLDNARDATQVAPLLPGAGPSRVVITSRNRLTGLVSAHGAHLLTLDVLDEQDACDVLAGHLGACRIEAEPTAVAVILRYCAGLPLALGVVAARAAVQPGLGLAELAAELDEATARLDAVDTGDTDLNLRSVLSWSYRALSPEATVLFGLLGLTSAPDIGFAAVASLTGWTDEDARIVLRELENAHLVTSSASGRYRMHDLVRLFAAERGSADLPEDQRTAALRRTVDHYVHSALAAERALYPQRRAIEPSPAGPGCRPETPADMVSAMAWFERELPSVMAVQAEAAERGLDQAVWHLAWASTTYLVRTAKHGDREAMWTAGLAAAIRIGDDDPMAAVWAHQNVADAQAHLGGHSEAVEHLYQALSVVEQLDDTVLRGHTHYRLAAAWQQQGDLERALKHAEESLRLYRTMAPNQHLAQGHSAVGWFKALLNQFDEARAHSEQALTLYREQGNAEGEAGTLDTLGYLAHHSGDHACALERWHAALKLYRGLGNNLYEAEILDRLASAHLVLGEHDAGKTAMREALRLYESQGRTTDAARVREKLA